MVPCEHGTGRPHVADGGTACNVKGSCESIEYAVEGSRQGVVLELGVFGRGVDNSTAEKCNMLRTVHTESLGPGPGTCECGNEHLGSIKLGEFLD